MFYALIVNCSSDTMNLFVADKSFTWFTCVGGFGSYLFGMTPTIAKQIPEAGTANDVKSLGLGWMIAFLFVVSFLGLFSVVPLRKVH
jgi:hypothetical protein